MDLTNLTDAEREAAEKAVAEVRKRSGLRYDPFSSTDYLDGVLSCGALMNDQDTLAYVVEDCEAYAPAMLNGLKLAEASDDFLIELATKHKVIDPTAWERGGEVLTNWRESRNFKPEFVAFLNALRSL